jgi:hypothetical protein
MRTFNKIVTAQVAKIARLNDRIGDLMSQRVTEEEKLAALLVQQWPTPTKNPVVVGGSQPFRGSQQVILEKRTPEGKLDFTGEQPPAGGMPFDAVWDLYTQTHPKKWSGSWDALREWLDSKGWIVREKTW